MHKYQTPTTSCYEILQTEVRIRYLGSNDHQ